MRTLGPHAIKSHSVAAMHGPPRLLSLPKSEAPLVCRGLLLDEIDDQLLHSVAVVLLRPAPAFVSMLPLAPTRRNFYVGALY